MDFGQFHTIVAPAHSSIVNIVRCFGIGRSPNAFGLAAVSRPLAAMNRYKRCVCDTPNKNVSNIVQRVSDFAAMLSVRLFFAAYLYQKG